LLVLTSSKKLIEQHLFATFHDNAYDSNTVKNTRMSIIKMDIMKKKIMKMNIIKRIIMRSKKVGRVLKMNIQMRKKIYTIKKMASGINGQW